MDEKRVEGCLTPLEVEKALVADGWEKPLASARQAHLEQCPECARRLEEARDAGAAFLERVVPRTLPSLQSESAPRRRPRWKSWWTLAAPVAAAAALLAVVLVPESVEITSPPVVLPGEPYVGIKGGNHLDVAVRRGGRTLRLPEAGTLRAGDQLRLRARRTGPGFVLVVHRDAAGEHSVVLPWAGERSAAVAPGSDWAGDGLLLDGARGEEYLVAVFTAEALDAAVVLAWLEAIEVAPGNGPVEVKGVGAEVVVVRYDKEAPP